jgi:predicted O-methyltransferase YrrM
MKELCYGSYATRIYLPLSCLSRRLRQMTRSIRGKSGGFLQATSLPQTSWKDLPGLGAPRVWEAAKNNGNVRISELAILCALAAGCEDGSNLFEIGTFDGRTALNLALNSPSGCHVYTLDLPPDRETAFAIEKGERLFIEKPQPGARYRAYGGVNPAAVSRIHQLLGDSATFDYSPYAGSCSLVFVDGSHAYDYAMSDTQAAMKLAKPGGVIVWHDYGVWEGVTRALEELEQRERYGLNHIRGTSLVWWRRSHG